MGKNFLIFLSVIIGVILLVVLGGNWVSCASLSQSPTVRPPAVAGQFYPAGAKNLAAQVAQFLEAAQPPETKGEILALILPHAGYQYSGPVAACGYKKLIGQKIDTVILIGNSHQAEFPGAVIRPAGFYQTPLGEVEIDSVLASAIISENSNFIFREMVDAGEHSLEVQLPFLQKTIKNFKIVPILLGNIPGGAHLLAAAILKNIKGKNVLLIASSDLSHYPSYENARFCDGAVIKAILTGRIKNVEQTVRDLENKNIPQVVTLACGLEAIKTVMEVAAGLEATEVKLLDYANSGDKSGDKNRVVGYAAIGFFKQRRDNLLNKSEKEKLLAIAKTSVESVVNEKKVPKFNVEEPMLNQNLGAFVTLRKHGNLRGCIGWFSPTDIPLFRVVSQMAIAAAIQDPRFFPVQPDELKDLKYEISVLSPLEDRKSVV